MLDRLRNTVRALLSRGNDVPSARHGADGQPPARPARRKRRHPAMWNSTCLDGPQRRTAAILTVLILSAAPAAAQFDATTNTSTPAPPSMTQSYLVEWDISSLGDLVPGALAVDDKSDSRKSKVWFATRVGQTQVYRFQPGLNMKKDNASAISWDLGAQITGGVRLRHSDDGRFVFINVNKDTT